MASSLLAVLEKISEAVGIFYFLLYRVEIERKPNILNVAEMTTVKDVSVSLQHSRLRDPVHSGGPAALLPLEVSKMPLHPSHKFPFLLKYPPRFLFSTNKSPNHMTKRNLIETGLVQFFSFSLSPPVSWNSLSVAAQPAVSKPVTLSFKIRLFRALKIYKKLHISFVSYILSQNRSGQILNFKNNSHRFLH